MNLFERKPKTTITISIIFIFFILELLSYLFLAHRDKPYLKFSERDKIIQKFDAHTFYNYNPNTSIKFDPKAFLIKIPQTDPWPFATLSSLLFFNFNDLGPGIFVTIFAFIFQLNFFVKVNIYK